MIGKLVYLVAAVVLAQASQAPPAEDGILPNGCPADWDVYKYLPHETDSTQFYHCIKGETFPRPCPGGTTFNAELEVCNNGDITSEADISSGVDMKRNSGSGNSGQTNSGNHNSGSGNSGHYNSGHNNSGNFNSGNNNSGNYNSGNLNTGHRNSGSRNTGSNNSGNDNTSSNNSGSSQSRNNNDNQEEQ